MISNTQQSHQLDAELAPLALNVLKLESLVLQSKTESQKEQIDTKRIKIFTDDIRSLTEEIKSQLKQASELGQKDIILSVIEIYERGEKAMANAAARQASGLPPPQGPIDNFPVIDDDGDMEKRLTILETILPTLATKVDIGEMRLAIESVRSETKQSVESVKTEIHKGIAETHKWMIGTVIGLFIGFGGLFMAMSNALKPAPQQAAQSPVTINNIPPQTQTPPVQQQLKK